MAEIKDMILTELHSFERDNYQDLRQLEVIGNIYDNPELTGGEVNENN